MQIDILLEEPSAEEALRNLLPKIIKGRARVNLINMRNKSRLLQELPARLCGYKRRIEAGEDLRLLILVDRDDDNCQDLKATLERMAREAGLSTKSSPQENGQFYVVNRIAIQELEAWFIGDIDALKKAFSSLRGVSFPKSFQNPDKCGKWEILHRFLRQNGIYRSNYPKIEAARKISQQIEISHNRSKSFQHFCHGLESILTRA
jgi:hypothetical protein